MTAKTLLFGRVRGDDYDGETKTPEYANLLLNGNEQVRKQDAQ